MASPSVFAELGALTSDNIPLSQLYTDIRDAVENYNQADVNFKAVLCETTTQHSVWIDQRGMAFRKASEASTPDMQHIPVAKFDLPFPEDYALATAVTQRDIDLGISSVQVTTRGAQAIEADKRLLEAFVIREALVSGSWWDGTETVAPPPYQGNIFDTDHNHFMAKNRSGIPTHQDFVNLKQHLVHHGFGRDVVGWMNSQTAAELAKVAEDQPAATYFLPVTETTQALQKMGYDSPMVLGGIPTYANDWIPVGYIAAWSTAGQRPFMWRDPEGAARDGGLRAWSRVPDERYEFFETYVRWCSVKCIKRGQGAVMYLGSDSWSDPTIPIDDVSPAANIAGDGITVS
jgi:hypothetical protein